jgi:queuine tRNA-ribosyltransferase
MVLDECPPWPCEYDYAAKSAEMTTRWAKRCKDWAEENAESSIGDAVEAGVSPANQETAADTAVTTARQLLFGIVQGATFGELRQQSAQAIVDLDFDGYAVGGISVGEPEEEMFRAIESSEPFLPNDKPRYTMGLGTPPQLLEMIARGADMFDCVLPTRLARNGTAFTSAGTINLKNAEYSKDKRPIEDNCECATCREFSRGYIRHLIKAEEILGLRLITLHNLHFYLDLMRQARDKIDKGTFEQFRREFVSNYETREVDPEG